MNNIFNIRRFGLVLSKDFREKWKKYGLQFLTIFGILAVILTLNLYNSYSYVHENRVNNVYDSVKLLQIASFLFLGFGIFYASTMMEQMREKTTRIAHLSMPASHFEKFSSRWLIVTIGYIIAFFIALWLADAVRIAVLSYKYPDLNFQLIDFKVLIDPKINSGNYVFYSKHFFLLCISFYALLHSLFMLGTTFWEKASFIKTFSAIVAIVLLFLLVNHWVIKIAYHNFNGFDGFGRAFDLYFGHFKEKTVMTFVSVVFAVFTFVNWTLAFFRFHESEIINRL